MLETRRILFFLLVLFICCCNSNGEENAGAKNSALLSSVPLDHFFQTKQNPYVNSSLISSVRITGFHKATEMLCSREYTTDIIGHAYSSRFSGSVDDGIYSKRAITSEEFSQVISKVKDALAESAYTEREVHLGYPHTDYLSLTIEVIEFDDYLNSKEFFFYSLDSLPNPILKLSKIHLIDSLWLPTLPRD